MPNRHSAEPGRQQRQPAVEGLAVKVEVESLVVALQARRQIDRAYREQLRTAKHRLRQRQRCARQRFLGVWSQQSAAAFADSGAVERAIQPPTVEHRHFAPGATSLASVAPDGPAPTTAISQSSINIPALPVFHIHNIITTSRQKSNPRTPSWENIKLHMSEDEVAVFREIASHGQCNMLR